MNISKQDAGSIRLPVNDIDAVWVGHCCAEGYTQSAVFPFPRSISKEVCGVVELLHHGD